MHRFRLLPLLGLFLVLSFSAKGQQAPKSPPTPLERDAQALSVLKQSFAAMGGALPTDTLATGTITIVAGSTTKSGTVRILSRGTDQTVEDIQTESARHVTVFSGVVAAETKAGTTNRLAFEPSASSQCYDFPLPLIAWALSNRDAALVYVGLESIEGGQAHHIRLWNTFFSAKHRPPAGFNVRDLWIDAATNLPLHLALEKRESGGDAPRIPLVYTYSDFRNVNGVLLPFQIQKSLNGTPWTTITISSANINTGLTNTDFPVPAGRAQ